MIEIATNIKHYWLATIVGFILTDNQNLVFWCGDGIYVIDDELTSIDQNNRPTYIAYNSLHVPDEVGVTLEYIPHNFEYKLLSSPNKIMIASDGFENHNTDKICTFQEQEPEASLDLNGQQWNKKGQFGLKKWMNSRSDRGFFEDDCFIITAEGTHLEKDNNC